jgi:dTDP-glucose 4,6-dehydratase
MMTEATNKTALITGGAGFLGSHLCDRFLKEGYRVICMDNLITGSLSNISHLDKNPDFKFSRHDVSKYIDIKDRLDIILHFASPASPIDYLNYPIQTLKVGSLGTHNALGLAKEKKAKILLASTSEIYGDPEIHPQPESYYGRVNCIGPRGVYDEAKRFAEAITMAYHKAHGLDTRIVRIFNTYGSRMRKKDGRAIPNFISQALKNEPITVYGKGTQTRSFCFVSDLIEGIYLLSQSDIHDPVNLGNPVELRIIDLAKRIIRFTKSKSRIIYTGLPKDDPKVRQPDIKQAKKLLNWKPRVKLEEGLEETIKWFAESAL